MPELTMHVSVNLTSKLNLVMRSLTNPQLDPLMGLMQPTTNDLSGSMHMRRTKHKRCSAWNYECMFGNSKVELKRCGVTQTRGRGGRDFHGNNFDSISPRQRITLRPGNVDEWRGGHRCDLRRHLRPRPQELPGNIFGSIPPSIDLRQ